MRITISIPKPCHKDWNAMHPQGSARFCDSCQHSVADLTMATDAELVALFTGNAPPKCARFDPRQLERVLGGAPEQGRNTLLPIAAFSSLLAVATGQETLAQDAGLKGETVIQKQLPASPPGSDLTRQAPPLMLTYVVGDTVVVEGDREGTEIIEIDGLVECESPVPDQQEDTELQSEGAHIIPGRMRSVGAGPRRIQGTLIDDRTLEKLPFAMVRISGNSEGTLTDADGRFTLDLPERCSNESLMVSILAIGYAPMEIPVTLASSEHIARECADTTMVKDLPLTGKVVDRSTGAILQGVLVEWVEKEIACCTDTLGMFGFPVEPEKERVDGTVRVTIPGHAPYERAIPPARLPFAFVIEVERHEMSYPEEGTFDLGEIRLQEGMVLGEIEVRKASVWRRFVRRFR